ncbi:uncharacterized protein K02A2.6-like [Ischnura elegans]|uniref:uncharacterized protein K02A2.6-like n=1 Tax=Ischnura elegans TaxID=197161 RepID=UPI001ED874C9|nr:uncharacterized protein K02A2.6-like [Ischnura elegans]
MRRTTSSAPDSCVVRTWECRPCGRKGHIAKVCRMDSACIHRVSGSHDEGVAAEGVSLEDEGGINGIHSTGEVGKVMGPAVCQCTLLVEGIQIVFEIYSGAAVPVMGLSQFQALFPKIPSRKCYLRLKPASGAELGVEGQAMISVTIGKVNPGEEKVFRLRLFVINSELPYWEGHVFDSNRQAKISYFKAYMVMKPGVAPIFRKAYDVPFKIRDWVKEEIDKLVEQGIFEPVRHSQWASPLVVDPKKNGELRLCIDYKSTVNTVIELDQYLLPRLDDILSGLSGGKVFVTLSVMDSVFQGVEGIQCYIDDVVIAGKSLRNGQAKSEAVMARLDRYGIRVNLEKCEFFKPSINYLEHKIEESGIRPIEGKLNAILNCPRPTTVQQSKSYLDAQVLRRILGPKVGIPTLAASRLQRWAIILAAYDYNVIYRKTVENADMLSRLPLPTEMMEDTECIVQIESPLNTLEIQVSTEQDTPLQKVKTYTLSGWPEQNEESLKPCFIRRSELSLSQGCLCWGNRVVIPVALREYVLKLLHEQHVGIARMKLLARSQVWWPGIDNGIKELAGYEILILVDSFSQWIEAGPMSNPNAQSTIKKLRGFMAMFGISLELVTDNGPPFQSSKFIGFCRANGIKVTKGPPYHPSSNGLAERGVRTVKESLGKQVVEMLVNHFSETPRVLTRDELEGMIMNFLGVYRNTPNAISRVTQASLILKHQPRSFLSMLNPIFNRRGLIWGKAEPAKSAGMGTFPKFSLFGEVLVKNPKAGLLHFLRGEIKGCLSKTTYQVRLPTGERMVHVYQLKKFTASKAKHPQKLSSANHLWWTPLPITSPPQPNGQGKEKSGYNGMNLAVRTPLPAKGRQPV